MRVYLSPATLLVVPATLIGHWREQVLDRVFTALLQLYHSMPGAGALGRHECIRMAVTLVCR